MTAPSSSGFGSTVICRLAERSLKAKVELAYARMGLSWRLECPRSAVEEAASGALPKHKAPEPQETSERRLRVLVVEDEAIVALEIEENLREAGFEVVGPAARVAEALRLLDEFGCDAAVLDINLGGETSEAIAIELTAKETPFVTLSGYSSEQHHSVFAGAPALRKPLRLQFLVSEIKRCIGQSTADL